MPHWVWTIAGFPLFSVSALSFVRCLKLPFHFDPERLHADLAFVHPDEWIPHINRKHYDGEWSGAGLRSIGGVANNIVPDAPDIAAFRDTDLLARCAYFREVLSTFHCPLQAVRLLRLHAGSNIAEHIDHALDFEDGEVRIHVPIVTNDQVRFFLDGARLVMAPGECWYTNVNLPHSVANSSAADRVHLVIDCQVNEWLRDLFASTPPPPIDHYAARLSLSSAPEPGAVFNVLSQYVGAEPGSPRFSVDKSTLVVQWAETHAWQVRLRIDPTPLGWSARVESSPDPERRHRASIEELFVAFAREFPAIAIAREGLA